MPNTQSTACFQKKSLFGQWFFCAFEDGHKHHVWFDSSFHFLWQIPMHVEPFLAAVQVCPPAVQFCVSSFSLDTKAQSLPDVYKFHRLYQRADDKKKNTCPLLGIYDKCFVFPDLSLQKRVATPKMWMPCGLLSCKSNLQDTAGYCRIFSEIFVLQQYMSCQITVVVQKNWKILSLKRDMAKKWHPTNAQL